MNVMKFTMPTNYLFGWDSISEVGHFSSGRTIIITDEVIMTKIGHLLKVKEILKSEKIEISDIINIDSEPSFTHLRDAWIRCNNHSPQTIIALGGGAVMDVAKAMYYLLNNRDTTIEDFLSKGIDFQPNAAIREKSCKLIAIPTTSGTGSEVTCAAVFSKPEVKTKKLYLSPELIPDTAILDPALTMTLPGMVTAQSGFDALTHAIESYLSVISTPLSQSMALKAATMIMNNLETAVMNGDDKNAREAMHYGSSMAGIAISNSCTGLSHSLDQIGSIFGIAHGAAMSPLFSTVIKTVAEDSPTALAEIAHAVGIEGSNDKEKAEELIKRIVDLTARIGLPLSFSELGIDEEEYMKAVELIIPGALEAFATKVFPVSVNEEILKSILIKAYK